MSNQSEAEDDSHLDRVECGAGCTEIWEHVSEQRREQRREQSDDD
jgi:hypothetical protein